MQDTKLEQKILSLPVAFFADAKVRLGLPDSHLDPGIRPTVPGSRMLGSAVTARLEVARSADTADLSLMSKAYSSPPESGCIMVVQVPEELHDRAIFGDGSAIMARANGYVGALVDGGVRDILELAEMQFPVFSRTITPGYILGKALAVATYEPVLVGGRTIHSGDLIYGDTDGVIVLRPDEVERTVERALLIKEWEDGFHAMLAAGHSHEETTKTLGPTP
jgi:4-hydroxy-4-methyl-2-oxoglutarate aldolase